MLFNSIPAPLVSVNKRLTVVIFIGKRYDYNVGFMKKENRFTTFALPLLIIFAGFIYWLTRPPSLLWVDSGTMIGAAASLGIPNPPGFPFYMISSHAFGILFPFFSWLTRLELFSIIFSLLTLTLVYKILVLIFEENYFFFKPATSEVAKSGSERYLTKSRTAWCGAFFGTTALAFSYQYWSQTQNTEAYIFTYFFLCLFIYLLLLIQKKSRALLGSPDKKARRVFKEYFFKHLLLIAFLYGLAAGANPTIAVLIPGVLFFMVIYRRYLSISKLLILGGVFIVTIALVYSYLPIRASSYPFVNWGNPQTVNLFLGHLHGQGLNIYEPATNSINGFTGSPIIFFQSVSHFFYLLLLQFTPFLIPFLLYGTVTLFKKNKFLFSFLLSIPLVDVIYSGLYYSGNQESWFIASFIVGAFLIGIGFYAFLLRINNIKIQRLAFLLCFLPLICWFFVLNRSGQYLTSDYAHNLYGTLGKNAILIETGDFTNSLGYYLHEADLYRPDVTPITANTFYVNKWYRDGLRHATNLVISDKIENIIQYKREEEYHEAMNTLIADNIDTRPIYVTYLTIRASAIAGAHVQAGLFEIDDRFAYIPHGLVYQIVKRNSVHEPDLKTYDFTFRTQLNQLPFYLEHNYNAGVKNLLSDYSYSYQALGDWYLDRKQSALAYTEYKKAYTLTPESVEILSRLGQYFGTIQNFDVSRQYFQKALALSPNNLQILFNLGYTYENLHDPKSAAADYQAIMQLAPQNPLAQQAQSRLEALGKVTPQTNQNAQVVIPTNGWPAYDTGKITFSYPVGWSVTNTIEGLVLTDQKKTMTITLTLLQKPSTQTVDQFVGSQTSAYGTLVQQGPALIPSFDAAHIRIWQKAEAQNFQFFLFKGTNVVQVLVTNFTNEKKPFVDGVIGSLKLK